MACCKSIRSLARMAGCTEQTIMNLENPAWKRTTQERIRAGIAMALGVTEDRLFTAKGVSK